MNSKIAPIALTAMLVVYPVITPGAAKDALYKSLGGKQAISMVVDEFVTRVAADSRINGFFKEAAADPQRLAKFKNESCRPNLRSQRRPL